jgi:phage host-nuclease inhibitor protein Gam
MNTYNFSAPVVGFLRRVRLAKRPGQHDGQVFAQLSDHGRRIPFQNKKQTKKMKTNTEAKARKSSRVKAEAVITSEAQFLGLVDETAKLTLWRDALALELETELAVVREKYAPKLAEMEEQLNTNLAHCEKYADGHREELFGKLKSRDSALTTFGFRKRNPALVLLNKNWKWKLVLKAIKEKGRSDLLIVKEDPDKDAIKTKLTDEERTEIGTKIRQVEAFFIDPKRDVPIEPRLVGEPMKAAA